MWGTRACWPCLTPSEWLWAGINQSRTMQWLERGKPGSWPESRCGLGRSGLQLGSCPLSAESPQGSHLVSLNLSFLLILHRNDSNPCLSGQRWRENIKLSNAILSDWLNFTFEAPDLFFFINLFIYLFLAALGLRCCAWAFSSCGERGLLFVLVRGLLIVVASLVAEHGL